MVTGELNDIGLWVGVAEWAKPWWRSVIEKYNDNHNHKGKINHFIDK